MNLEDFQKIDLRVGTIKSANRVEGSSKLLNLSIDLGEKDAEGQSVNRQILSGIGKTYEPEAMIGLQVVVIANLEPREMMGLVSHGMVLATSGSDGIPVVLTTQKTVESGSRIT